MADTARKTASSDVLGGTVTSNAWDLGRCGAMLSRRRDGLCPDEMVIVGRIQSGGGRRGEGRCSNKGRADQGLSCCPRRRKDARERS